MTSLSTELLEKVKGTPAVTRVNVSSETQLIVAVLKCATQSINLAKFLSIGSRSNDGIITGRTTRLRVLRRWVEVASVRRIESHSADYIPTF